MFIYLFTSVYLFSVAMVTTMVYCITHLDLPITCQMLDYLEACVDELTTSCPNHNIILAGDFNGLPIPMSYSRTNWTLTNRPPCNLWRQYSWPRASVMYSTVRVVSSALKSDHKAVVACSSKDQVSVPKTTVQRTYRQKSPKQHALFL